MFDDFFVRAMVAGVGVAVIAGPLGCFVVWRRLAYFGETLAHSALLGVALGFALQINLSLAVFVVSAAIAMALVLLQQRQMLHSDTLLGLLSHGSLALGLVIIALMSWLQVDLLGLLFGDILSVSTTDIAIVYGGGLLILGVLVAIWRPLFAATVSGELAKAEGGHPLAVNLIFMLLMALAIVIAMKIVGVLLITALLIIPPAAVRRLASGPEQMALFAALAGVLAVVLGLMASLRWDTPSGPSIVVAALALFLVSLTPFARALPRVGAKTHLNPDPDPDQPGHRGSAHDHSHSHASNNHGKDDHVTSITAATPDKKPNPRL